jgi:hypothetical protein
MPQPSDLVATWRLVSWENATANGVSHPMGRDAKGYISYGADGWMAVQIMRPGRRHLTDDGVEEASDDLVREVLGGYFAYAGSYVVDPAAGTVTHRIEYALLPAQVGSELTRWFEIDGNRLTLRMSPPAAARPSGTAGPRTGGRLVWQRLD